MNAVGRVAIARLNADGSTDTGFNPGSGGNDWVEAVALQPDGKVLIGGSFTSFNGTPRNRIARLNANGSLDTTFNPGSGVDNTVNRIAVQSDGKVLLVGAFTTVNGVSRNRIARLNADGSLDTSFNPGTGANGFVMRSSRDQDDIVALLCEPRAHHSPHAPRSVHDEPHAGIISHQSTVVNRQSTIVSRTTTDY